MESKAITIENLIRLRDELLERQVEPYIDEVLRLLDPENTHNWNLMDNGDLRDYEGEQLETAKSDWEESTKTY